MDEAKDSSRFETLIAAPATLAELVDYQAGSVVSKTLIAKKTGTVTLFAFAEGQGLSEHSAPFDATVCLVEGEAEMTVSGKPFRVRAGEIVILPANDPHAVRAVKQFKMLLIMIRS
jgi:quercetin dioxygenase-like cupin family protein